MHDDVSRGAVAPIPAGGGDWNVSNYGGGPQGPASDEAVTVGLTGVVLSVIDEQPVVLVSGPSGEAHGKTFGLPTAGFWPGRQPCLEAAVREAVVARTGCRLGYVEQLLTDYGPNERAEDGGVIGNRLSVSYLALTRSQPGELSSQARWLDCYRLLPWEDFRAGEPAMLAGELVPALKAWAEAENGHDAALASSPPRACAYRVRSGWPELG